MAVGGCRRLFGSYWNALCKSTKQGAGRDPIDAGSKTVAKPSSQRIEGSGLAGLFAEVQEIPS